MLDIVFGTLLLVISILFLFWSYKIRHEKYDHPSANVSKTQIVFFSILGIIISLLLFLRGFGID